jgi:hypothetical protein
MTYYNDQDTMAYQHLKRALYHKVPNIDKFQFTQSPEYFTTYLYVSTASGTSLKVDLGHTNLDTSSIPDIFQHIDEQFPELNI